MGISLRARPEEVAATQDIFFCDFSVLMLNFNVFFPSLLLLHPTKTHPVGTLPSKLRLNVIHPNNRKIIVENGYSCYACTRGMRYPKVVDFCENVFHCQTFPCNDLSITGFCITNEGNSLKSGGDFGSTK
jgi:hypothetical protein